MSYSCPDCEDGTLETKLREVDLELAEGESAFIVNGVAVITSVGCDNGCSADAEAEEEEGSRDLCTKVPGCTRSKGHRGRHVLPKLEAA
jgi:hypothetical protein